MNLIYLQVEIVSQNPIDKTEDIKTTNLETYRMVNILFPCE